MKKLFLLAITSILSFSLVPTIQAQDRGDSEESYSRNTLERYWECRERNDLDEIKRLLTSHRSGRRIDASLYGLPKDDFDDKSLLTIAERVWIRSDKAAHGVRLPVSGPLQYPHHMRRALDHMYEQRDIRSDCSEILEGSGATFTEPRSLDAGWASDLNLTSADGASRGEVDIAIDPADPSRIMASSIGSGGETSNHLARTSNWGQTWSSSQVGNNSGSSWECDPVSYYQRYSGKVYHSKIGCSNGSCSQTYTMMKVSSNNGSSWSDCARPGNQGSEDRQWHVVDNNPTSACYGNIYLTWHNSNQQIVATSSNDCASWTNRTNLTGTYQAITPDISVGADGHVYAVWQNHGDSTFKIAGSSNCGATWSSPSAKTLKSRLGDWSNAIPAQCQRGVPTQPNVDVDRAAWSQYYGRVYAIVQDFSGSCSTAAGWTCSQWDSNWSNTCNFDFYLMYSDNDGATWSSPVNITAGEGNKVDHFLGYMRVDEGDGSIYIGYHRSRLNPTSAADRQKTTYRIMRSTNGGASWTDSIQASSVEGNERSSGASSFERGDYGGFSVLNGTVWPVWIDRRGGSGEEEIVTRKICTEPTHRSERAPSFSAPATTATPGSGQQITISWTAPDVFWGDGDESASSRKYQLWVDGSLEQDNISASSTSTTYTAADCSTSHTFFIRAVNSCNTIKDYASTTATATGCSTCNPSTVTVSPAGPVTTCGGASQSLSVTVSGGTGPFSYQWTRDGVNISGATTSSYSASDSGSHTYNCKVTGSGSGCTAVQDTTATQITWQAAASFAGLQTVATPASSTCTLDLSWNAATACSGTVSYRVYRSTSNGFTPSAGNRIATGVSSTGYTDNSGLDSATTYYYVVRAVANSTGVEDSNSVQGSGQPVGPSTSGTWSDDIEPADAGWTHGASSGIDDWNETTAQSHSASHSWAAADAANLTDKWLTLPAKNLSASSVLTFWHSFDFEAGYDGGVLEVSTNGGSSWADMGSAITTGGYNRTLSTSYQNPIGGRNSWSSTQASFTQVTVNLSSYSGADRLIRWRMGCDSSVGKGSWYVDDIQITNTEVFGTCGGGGCTTPVFSGITSATDVNGCADTGVNLGWSLPSNWGDTSSTSRRFDIERNGSVIASVGASTTSFTDSTAPDSVSLTYAVVAVNDCGSTSDGAATRNVTNVDSEPAPSFGGLSSVSNSGSDALTLAWSSGSAACGSGVRYNVYRSTSSTFTPSSVNRIVSGTTSTGYTDSALSEGTYYYVVRAEDNTSGHSGPNGGVEESNTTRRSGTIAGAGGGDWLDDLEAGATGWSHAAGTNTDDWTLTTADSNSTSHSWTASDVDALADKWLISPAKDASATSELSFWHKYDFETNYDGGVLEISADGGGWTDLGSAVTAGGYTSTIDSGYNSPIAGRQAWSGLVSSYTRVTVNLAAYAGSSVQVRWRLACDSSVAKGPWYVDDIQITNLDGGGGGPTCSTPSFGGLSSATDVNGCATTGVSLSWSAPSDWGDDGSGSRSISVLRGGAVIATLGSTATSYTDTSAPANVSLSYSVRANNGCGSDSDGSVSRTVTNVDSATAPSFSGLGNVSAGGSCNLALSWNAASAACGSGVRYNVYRSTSSSFTPSGSNRIVTGTTSTSYTDNSVGSGTYYYIVRAEDNTSGHSGPSGGVEDSNTVTRSGSVGGGSSTVTLYDTTFETGTGLDGWGSGNFSGDTVGWRGIQTCSASSGSRIFRFGGTSCTSNYGNDKFSYVNPGGSAGISIPADATGTRLSFNHRWAFETNYDGAMLLISTNGTNYTFVPSAAIISGTGYTHTSSTYCPPTSGGGHAIWSGTRSTFTNTVVDLDAAANAISGNTGGAAGKNIWIAFTVITDCSTTADGWFFDDVIVTATAGSTCGAAVAPRDDSDRNYGQSIQATNVYHFPPIDLSYEEPIIDYDIQKD